MRAVRFRVIGQLGGGGRGAQGETASVDEEFLTDLTNANRLANTLHACAPTAAT
ncbi:hypothetical protein [Nocardia asiatica]|uniref:hypothetical protein n=1 Tax=Nocardia asiatica TaxID=209252 RepID=UPI002454BAE6|nr:hypothetical protein [Nocardia asiatica]